MKVLIGVDPHKASIALAAVDESGQLIECVGFPQNRAGLRALERWVKRFPERRWAIENAGGLGRHLAQRWLSVGSAVGGGWRVRCGRGAKALGARPGTLDRQRP